MGDCAAVPDTGRPQPPTAQHALRQARHAAKNIEAVLTGHEKKPFRFSTIGQLASIGHRRGVANILGMNFSGFIAWCLWRSVYLLRAPAAREEDARGALLGAGDDLLEGSRADADPSGHRADLANRDIAAQRRR
jgi:NADH dehydrogenase FAD-containing subunit